MRTQFSKFALAAGITLALAFTSCSSDKDDGGNNNGGGGGSIVNADNEAWVNCSSFEKNIRCFGAIFKQNGEYIEAYRQNGGNWHRIDCEGIKTYSISGNQLTFCDQENYCDVRPYSISGNTLTIVEEGWPTLTRTSGVHISGDCE